jgi:regulatory protein
MDDGGEEQLAPVIPLFGGSRSATPGDQADVGLQTGSPAAEGAGLWRSTWHDPVATGAAAGSDGEPSERHPARGGAARPSPRLRALNPHDDSAGTDELDPAEAVESASEALVRKLRARSMSVAEASTFLRGQQLAAAQIDEIIETFCSRKYLDDQTLAGHLVTSGHERKGLGRVALGRVLAQRGIPRDIADAALAELPDDDTERALEFARTKARAMARLDPEAAKRRLSGQLARRGYPGSVVTQVVRQVLAEQSSRSRTAGVRFEDSDD